MDPVDHKLRNLGLAFIAHGMVIGAWVLFCIFGGLILLIVALMDDAAALPMGGLALVYAALAAINGFIALLHIMAGVQLRKGGGLMLTIAGLATTLICMILALYCSPASLGLLVYGIIVLADGDVRARLDQP